MTSTSSTLANTTVRTRRVITSRQQHLYQINHNKMINFAGNDYLGLADDDRIKQAFISGVDKFGFGSASSPMLSGYSSAHQQLEEAFAAFSGRERALFFNSGYHANLGVLTSFSHRDSIIVADKHIHASLIDGANLSRARLLRYRHHDRNHAETLLRTHADKHSTLVSESVFSMSGAVTDTRHLSTLAKQYRARLIVDDAHGIGILGDNGRGTSEHFHLEDNDISILVTPFGKALAGMGAMVSGSKDDMEYLLQHARTYCYSTALPPSICAANLKALQIIDTEVWRRSELRRLISFFQTEAAKRELPLASNDLTPIQCVMTGENQPALDAQSFLLQHGIFVAAIRPPTVPPHTARLRISLSVTHSESELHSLLDLLAEWYASQKQ